jgi:hypothetical protein
MNILTELIIRSILVVAINDAVIFYWLNKRSQKISWPLTIGVIFITCLALIINIWYCLYRRGLL